MIDALIRALAPGRVETSEPLPPGVALRRASWLPALGGMLARMGAPAAAVTLGRTIVLHPSVPLTRALLRHELAHVRQWQEAPLGFPTRYLWYSIRYGYEDNPFEVEARQAESE